VRVDPDGRRYVLHRSLVEWVELLEDGDPELLVTHPLTREPALMAADLFDRDTTSIDAYFAHLDDASFDVPVQIEDRPIIASLPTARVAFPRAPRRHSYEIAWNDGERALVDRGWAVIYFGANP